MRWDDIADAYLALDEDRDQILAPILIRTIAETSAKRMADIGGGDGRFLDLLTRHYGVTYFKGLALTDPSERMRTRAASRLAGVAEVQIVAAPEELAQGSWDLALLVAVWMALPRYDECVDLLRRIRSLLAPNGRLFAAVTHPCFRDRSFHSYSTNFDMGKYHVSGSQFKVTMFDGVGSLAITDTHWTIADHLSQLADAGLLVERVLELSDVDPSSEGCPWLALVARPDSATS